MHPHILGLPSAYGICLHRMTWCLWARDDFVFENIISCNNCEELNTKNGMHPGARNTLLPHSPIQDDCRQTLLSPPPLPEAGTQSHTCFGPGLHFRHGWRSSKDSPPGRAVCAVVIQGNCGMKMLSRERGFLGTCSHRLPDSDPGACLLGGLYSQKRRGNRQDHTTRLREL